jgi:EAL domain-containing protein (putative c-di-GMP-specific phosphodiesterase class I)
MAIFPFDGGDADTLVRNADTAMYEAKAHGRACYRFYNEQMNALAAEHLKLEEELRDGIKNNDLVLHYQPLVDCHTGRVTAMEALLRWPHRRRGVVMPGEFIPVAERTGLIVELGTWILEEVARQANRWEEAQLGDFHMCVNVSPLQFNQPNFINSVAEFLERTNMNPEKLEFELTESAIMTDAGANIERLKALKKLGITLAVDDFGTGYSSLSYLKQFPIDTLKIDRGFVGDLPKPDSKGIVDAILALARTLGLKVVAEGVETATQMDYLIKRDCDMMQGYFISHPVRADDIPVLMSRDLRGRCSAASAG